MKNLNRKQVVKDTDFTKLLTSCAKAAEKHRQLMQQVSEECERRYGCNYSDIDADRLIDILGLHGADKLTATEFDESMKLHGASRIDN